METADWKTAKRTKKLRLEIADYVQELIKGDVPHVSFNGYKAFINTGSRKESEISYFNVRKALSALGLYLQWEQSKEAIDFFNEVLWSVANEFSWCLAAHINYDKDKFMDNQDKNIDLFAAETAQSLSELITIHKEIIDPFIRDFVKKQIENRVFSPFLEQNWKWERSVNNWCAVCGGSVGMAALLLEEGERQKQILDKVDKALVYYLKSFREDGATEEGIGYWAYGFGYYTYYTAMRREIDENYRPAPELLRKLKKIAEFPSLVQISKDIFIPFSDASTDTQIPTGLISYLYKEYGVTPPICEEITPFDFEHCYRFAHLSRNLWWTSDDIFQNTVEDSSVYFKDLQWLVQRKNKCFLAVKGGNNMEEHNHNDTGSFILAIDGEVILTDLGAGPYTAGYFSEKKI